TGTRIEVAHPHAVRLEVGLARAFRLRHGRRLGAFWRKATAERTRIMKRTSEIAAAVIALGALAPWAAAQDTNRTTDTSPPPAPPPAPTPPHPPTPSPSPADAPLAWDLYLKSGRVLHLQVVEVRDDSAIVTSRDFPDGRATLPFSELSEYTMYELLASRMDQR